jgi:TolA-binding protein
MFNRRSVLAGAAGVGLATALGATLGKAQESTPVPGSSTTPPAGGTTEGATTTLLQRIDDVIAQVQADRDAVSSSIDVTLVDQLLAKASAFRDQVASATKLTGVETFQQAHAAISLARAASAAIVGELSNFGLPSQQARTSRVLAAVHGAITEISDLAASSTDVNVTEALSLAQQLYQSAYEAYNAGTYAKATALARAAGSTAEAAALAAGLDGGKFGREERWFGPEDGPAGPGFGKGGRRREHRHLPELPDSNEGDIGDGTSETPVEVPAPDFW